MQNHYLSTDVNCPVCDKIAGIIREVWYVQCQSSVNNSGIGQVLFHLTHPVLVNIC